MAKYDKADLERRMKGAVEALRHDLSGLRTGRANTALLDDIARMHDQNQVGIHDRRQPMRDHKARAALHKLSKRMLNMLLRAGIYAACGLVQYEHWRQAEHYARDAQ